MVASETDAAERVWNAIGEIHFADYVAGRMPFEEQRRRRVRQFLTDRGVLIGASDDEAESWFAAYLAHCDATLVAFDDVRPALDMLRMAGLRIGAISNATQQTQDRKLHLVGLRSDVEALICCVDIDGITKPDRRIFLAGCAALGVQAGEAAYVGDDLVPQQVTDRKRHQRPRAQVVPARRDPAVGSGCAARTGAGAAPGPLLARTARR
jgi:putative hydrolase of the HAD superfamily